MTRRLGVSVGIYRAQSPRNAPNEMGFDMTISAAPMKAGMNPAAPIPSRPEPKAPSKLRFRSPANAMKPAKKSRVAAVTAILFTSSMNLKP
jgi:hypothetical protein